MARIPPALCHHCLASALFRLLDNLVLRKASPSSKGQGHSCPYQRDVETDNHDTPPVTEKAPRIAERCQTDTAARYSSTYSSSLPTGKNFDKPLHFTAYRVLLTHRLETAPTILQKKPHPMQRKDISPERKDTYYLGMALCAIGLLLFLSTFVSFISHFGDFNDFEHRSKSGMVRAFAGVISIAIGQFLMRLGRSGLAGSGLKLDPQDARKDLEPWSRMAGGMLKDTLDEAEIDLKRPSDSADLPFDEQLRRLESLKSEGLISEAEFAAARQKILDTLGR